jgi:membrane-anchored protein YejM (alkaline phosphatase superfamily)
MNAGTFAGYDLHLSLVALEAILVHLAKHMSCCQEQDLFMQLSIITVLPLHF